MAEWTCGCAQAAQGLDYSQRRNTKKVSPTIVPTYGLESFQTRADGKCRQSLEVSLLDDEELRVWGGEGSQRLQGSTEMNAAQRSAEGLSSSPQLRGDRRRPAHACEGTAKDGRGTIEKQWMEQFSTFTWDRNSLADLLKVLREKLPT